MSGFRPCRPCHRTGPDRLRHESGQVKHIDVLDDFGLYPVGFAVLGANNRRFANRTTTGAQFLVRVLVFFEAPNVCLIDFDFAPEQSATRGKRFTDAMI